MGVSDALLITKLTIPPTRPGVVSRPRLIAVLDSSLSSKLTLISAPAGFGKTTLIIDWLTRCDSPGAWFQLDDADSDVQRFLTYLITALQTIAPSIGEGILGAIQSTEPPSVEWILTDIINEIAAVSDDCMLVLDDYHLINSEAVDNVLTFLLDHSPPQLHLVIVTRQDPQLPLARLRARNQLTELRASDLRFTISETAEFLNQVMSLDLSTEDIAALETRTEGWIAGLQLAAISMQGREDAPSFIQSFTGSHHYVLDYLIEEVLHKQPADIQDFLLKTAILDRLTGPLCDALTGLENGQTTLEGLEQANLFLSPLDEERCWYRYHHLFADLLRQRLYREQSQHVSKLNQRASTWYEHHNDLPQAIHYALTADDIDNAIRLIEKAAYDALARGELRSILNWVNQLPDTALEGSPTLLIYYQWALLLTGQFSKVGVNLHLTDGFITDLQTADDKTRRTILGLLYGLKEILALWQLDFDHGFELARQARECLPEDSWCRGYCAIVEGAGYFALGDLNSSERVYTEAFAVGQAANHLMVTVSAACNLAYILELRGQPKQAFERYQSLFPHIEMEGKAFPVAGYVYGDIAKILYEFNDLDSAREHLEKGIKLCQRLADGRAEMIEHSFLVRVQLALGDYAGARASIEAARQANPSPETVFDLRGGEYPEIRLWLKEDRLSEIEAWLSTEELRIDALSNFKEKLIRTMHARTMIAIGAAQSDSTYLTSAVALLDQLMVLAEGEGWYSKLLEILVLKAMAHYVMKDPDQALPALERALILAEYRGFVRIFVDEGPPMAALLHEALSRGIMPDYVRRLLAAFPEGEPKSDEPARQQASDAHWIEPLSERETEVLQLMAVGLSNPEIAERLFLSVHTIKVHARNLYSKLGVHNRTQAVTTAQQIGILNKT
jgi:LuxR family maltose regulon positive regulatory protein